MRMGEPFMQQEYSHLLAQAPGLRAAETQLRQIETQIALHKKDHPVYAQTAGNAIGVAQILHRSTHINMSDAQLPALPAEKGAWDEKELSRRKFLEITFWAVTGITAVGILGAGSRFLAGNSLEPVSSNWVEIGKVAELPKGAVNRVNYAMKAKDAWREVTQKGALFVHSADGATFTVLDGTCTHLGCIVQWDAADNNFRCPCHSARFTRDGVVMDGPPPKPLRNLQSKVENGVLMAQI